MGYIVLVEPFYYMEYQITYVIEDCTDDSNLPTLQRQSNLASKEHLHKLD